MNPFEPKKFGRYLLIDKLAVGGMAEIYKAKTYGVNGFEKLLAIKRILPHCSADKEFIGMLVDEAKLTVLLSHANIVQVFDLGKVGDDYYISMEFINGTNLREFIKRVHEKEGKIPEDVSAYITSEVCKGLDYAHRKTDQRGSHLNIVHRDINPQNILISYEGEVKIVDFGIAKAALNVSHTMLGVLKGKIAYMSPEQALGKPLDGRTDIYSTGLVLYELVTGKKLYTGETQFEILNKIRTVRVDMNDLPDGLNASLKAILAKALAHNTNERFQAAGDFHLELTKYLYSSYVDFSPRKLADMVHKYFSEEMKATEEKGPEPSDRTHSLLVKPGDLEGSLSKDIPPDSGIWDEPTDSSTEELSHLTSETVSQEMSAKIAVPEARKKGRRVAPWLVLTLLVGIGGYWGWTNIEKISSLWKGAEERPPAEPVANVGSIIVSSEPTGANILLNGKNIGKTTPETLMKLPLGNEYTIAISKEHYGTFQKSVTLVTEDSVKVHATLEPLPDGIIEILSDPPEATIILNGEDTGKKTPARLSNLAIDKDYSVSLKKEGYIEWATTVPLTSFTPVDLRPTLVKTPATQAAPTKPVEIPQAAPVPQAEVPAPALPKEPTPPMPVAAGPVFGTLTIRSEPSEAAVYLNDKGTGRKTPTELGGLEVGKYYTIKLKKDGYKGWSKGWKLKGKEGERLIASLVPIEPPPEPSPKVPSLPAKEVTPTPEPEPTPAKRPVVGNPGVVRVKSNPSGADVYINSEYKGKTPIKIDGVSPGSATIMISKSGYLSYHSSISVGSGEDKNLGTISLEGFYGEVKVETSPPRADVYFDGRLIGAKTPVTIRQVPRNKTHSLKVQMSGYRSWEAAIDLSEEANKRFNIGLQKN